MGREFKVELTATAEEAFGELDRSDQQLVLKQLEKLKTSPQLGQPLRAGLSGYRKLYAARKRLRIIYQIEDDKLVVTVIAIGQREGEAVYVVAEAEAARRRLRRIS